MAYSSRILRQLGHPSGLLGRLVLRRLNKVNSGMNAFALDALGPGEGDRVLEVGFGGGALIGRMLAETGAAFVAGTEISELAVKAAGKRFAGDVADGRAAFRICGESSLPFDDGYFTAAVCVNVIYFWPDVPSMLADVRRVLAPGGRFVLAYAEGAPDRVTRFPADEVERLLREAGFAGAVTRQGSDAENGRYHCTVATVPPEPVPDEIGDGNDVKRGADPV